MKDELGGKIMAEFVALRTKTYSYLTDDWKEDKKAKGTKKCVIKRRLKFNDYKYCLLNNEIILKSQEKTGLYGNIYDFVVDCEEILGVKPIYDMHRYLMTKHNISL